MGKVKERKSDTWKPGMVSNGAGMISKNKKRKEKRLSQNLSFVKSNSDDTPSKKAALAPSNKIKESLNHSLNLPSLGKKKENKLLSTSLPIKGDKKAAKNDRSPQKKNVKLAGILSNSNTPRKKNNKVTFDGKKNDIKFIDNEAAEGEEPITHKVVKPYEKGSYKRKLQQLKNLMQKDESSDDEESDNSDIDDIDNESLIDMEASEGEETDSEEDDDDDDDDEFFNDDSEDEDNDSELEFSDDDEDDGSDDDEEDDDENDEEEADSSESDSKMNSKPTIIPTRRESVVLPPMKKEKKSVPSTPQQDKTKVKSEPGKAKVQQQQQAAVIEKGTKANEKTKNSTAEIEKKQLSQYVGFIRQLPSDFVEEALKSALLTKVEQSNIVGFVFKKADRKKRNAFVYLNNEESLDALLNHKFVVNEKISFMVYKARESVSSKVEKFLAFLPRVPLSITAEVLQEALAKEVGGNAILAVRFRKTYPNHQTRNTLVEFSDLESLKKVVVKGELKINNQVIIIRAAFEAGIKIPTYKVLFTCVPEKTTEAALKKAIESQVGKDTVLSVRFAMKKSSYAFVTFKNEESQKKALKVGSEISINGTKLVVKEFVALAPKKRAKPNQQAKERKKDGQKRKLDDGASVNSSESPKKKAKKSKSGPAATGDVTASKVDADKKTPNKAKHGKNVGSQNAADKNSNAKPKPTKNKQFAKQGKGNQKPAQPNSPKNVTNTNGQSSSPKQKKKNRRPNQASPKPVDAKKQALKSKLQAKRKMMKQKGVKKEE